MSADLKEELVQLNFLSRAELMDRWRTLHDKVPPSTISRGLLLQAIAYRLQEKSLGGLTSETRRYLAQIAADSKASVSPASTVRPGTRLLREWHGVTYEVLIMDHYVMFNRNRYRSLSEVAREITGVKWSGPVFFGLRKKRRD